MDVTLLRHLSDDALRKEAQRRGLDVSQLSDRGALIAALEQPLVPTPSSNAPSSNAPSSNAPSSNAPPPKALSSNAPSSNAPPPKALSPHAPSQNAPPPKALSPHAPSAPQPTTVAPKKSRFGGARALLGRVVDLARGALERRSSAPPPPPPDEPESKEPIRTRTMAEVLIDQGELERGLALLRDLTRKHPEDNAIRERVTQIEGELLRCRLTERARQALKDRPTGTFVELVKEGSLWAALWRLDAEGQARAQALLSGDGNPTLRVIAVGAKPDGAVERRQHDHIVEPTGFEILEDLPQVRWVVAVGLANAQDRFVSASHTASDD